MSRQRFVGFRCRLVGVIVLVVTGMVGGGVVVRGVGERVDAPFRTPPTTPFDSLDTHYHKDKNHDRNDHAYARQSHYIVPVDILTLVRIHKVLKLVIVTF